MKYKRSNEPIVWSMFGAGGMVAAFLLPALTLAVGVLHPFGLLESDAMSFARVSAFSAHWLGKICWLTVIVFPLWHAMHRIYHGLHDFKIGAQQFFFYICYGFALLVSIAASLIVLAI